MTRPILKSLSLWLSKWRQAGANPNGYPVRYLDYEIQHPHEHDSSHDRVWTAADGVWHCRDCNEWYRVWKYIQIRPERQEAGV